MSLGWNNMIEIQIINRKTVGKVRLQLQTPLFSKQECSNVWTNSNYSCNLKRDPSFQVIHTLTELLLMNRGILGMHIVRLPLFCTQLSLALNSNHVISYGCDVVESHLVFSKSYVFIVADVRLVVGI